MKRIRRLLPVMCLLLAVLLTACGEPDTKKEELVYITDGSEIDQGDRNILVWEAVQRYAQEQKLTCAYVVPETSAESAYDSAVSQAADSGAKIIVCAGREFEHVIYRAQRDYRSVRFLMLDGVPADPEGKERLRGNTRSIEPDEREAGYLAGYAAVASGYTSLGYLGGRDETSGARYGSGFVQGAEDAAKKLGLPDGAVSLQYENRKTDEVSPDFLQEMRDWYRNGCQAIFTGDSSCENVVQAAADETGGAVIRIGGDSLSSSVVIAVRLEYGNVIYEALSSIARDEYQGGEKATAGVTDQGISLLWNAEKLPAFTDALYQDISKTMKAEDFKLNSKDALEQPEECGIAKVTVLRLNETKEDAAEPGGEQK